MSSDWIIKKIDEIKADIANAIAMGPFGSNIKTDNFVDEGVPIIRGTNLSYGKLFEHDYVFLTDEKADQLKASNAFPGDLVFTHRGTLGQVGIIPMSSKYKRYVVSQSQMKLTCDTGQVEPLFVYYFFKSNIGQHALLMNTSTTGVPAISRPVTSLKTIEITMPIIEEQRRIVAILNSLDDKIELNNTINKNLEEMAQALFKRWFVDFEFPNENGEPYKSNGGEFEESDLGLIPKGWKIGTATDLFEVQSGGTPKTDNSVYWNGEIPFFTPKDSTKSFYVNDTEKKITDEGLSNCNSKLYKMGTVFITARGTVGKLAIAGRDMAMNQSCYALVSKDGFTQKYIFLQIQQLINTIKKGASGAVFDAITVSTFQGLKIVMPSIDLVIHFEKIVEGIFLSILKNVNENQILSNARDTLLPKLMSGEIRVPVEQEYEQTVDLPSVAETSMNYISNY